VESQNGSRMDNTRDYGRPRWCLDVTATLLHGGMVSSRQVTSKVNETREDSLLFSLLFSVADPDPGSGAFFFSNN
jgi:hypothetical protein